MQIALLGGSQEELIDPYQAAVLGLNPTMYWRLGETSGTNADEENDNFDGTYTNGPALGAKSLVPNSVNTAVTFDRESSQYVTASPQNAGTTWSVVMWINTSDTSTLQVIFHAIENSGSFNGFSLHVAQTTGFLTGITTNNTAGNSTWASTTDVADGADHQVAATFGVGGSATLYVDGAPVTSFSGQRIVSAATDPLSIDIGRRVDGFHTEGVIDDVAFWPGVDIGAAAVAATFAASQ